MDVRIEESWKKVLQGEFEKPYFDILTSFVRQEYQTKQCFPPAKNIFQAFDACPFDAVRVVIIGQDPYHDIGQANGLCFSVNDGIQIPPSLQNIYKEILSDTGRPSICSQDTQHRNSGNLLRWAEQGVLLLNATLTVEAHKAGSHQNKGWEDLTDAAIRELAEKKQNLVFLLWGSYAQKKGAFISPKKHLILKAAHPSPLSAYRGFFGCKHFTQTNKYLLTHGKTAIEW